MRMMVLRMRLLAAGLSVALAAACGGAGDSLLAGVGSGGTGGGTPTSALGLITGFGSVIVNGVRFDDSAARVVDDDGRDLGDGSLRLGMVVLVDGTSDASGLTGVASNIEVISELRGPVQTVSANSFSALGVTVNVSPATVLDGFAGLSELSPGAQVEVNGFLDAGVGQIAATRVALLSGAPPSFKARGLVGAVAGQAQTMQFGSLIVDYSAATLIGLPDGPKSGAVVRLTSSRAPGVDNLWRVDAVELVKAPELQESSRVSLEGSISEFASVASFTVQGVRVNATSARFDGGTAASLGDGVRVEVDGTLTGGVLEAVEVEIEGSSASGGASGGEGGTSEVQQFEIEGAITSVSGPLRFVVRGTAVDASQAQLESGSAASVVVGRQVHVKGRSVVDGVLKADLVHFED